MCEFVAIRRMPFPSSLLPCRLSQFLTLTTSITTTRLSRLALLRSPLSSCLSSSSSYRYNPNAVFRMEKFWTKNTELVAYLQKYGLIRSKKIADVMKSIDRALFVPKDFPPYLDSPMELGYNATISAPHMHASCLELLQDNLQPGMRALDVGSGSGYLTSCFALMVGREGRVVGVEHIPELVAFSILNIQNSAVAPLLKEGSLSVHAGDGRLGWSEFAPYDAIHVGAAAPEIPQALIDQLKPGGRMVIPVGNIFQDLKVVEKDLDGSVSVRKESSVRYVPLTSRDSQLKDY